jgi:hypothetical protein
MTVLANLDDIEREAEARLSTSVYDYVAGGANAEDRELHPSAARLSAQRVRAEGVTEA